MILNYSMKLSWTLLLYC